MISVVIMAGGKGERFWPKSRINSPKQFLSLTDDGKSMIQHTVERLKDIVEFENIYVVTNELYKGLVNEHIPEIPKENIIVEPVAKNTAPCIGLAAIHIACIEEIAYKKGWVNEKEIEEKIGKEKKNEYQKYLSLLIKK